MKNGEVCLRKSYDKEQSKTLVPLTPNLFIGNYYIYHFCGMDKTECYAKTVAREMIPSPCLIREDPNLTTGHWAWTLGVRCMMVCISAFWDVSAFLFYTNSIVWKFGGGGSFGAVLAVGIVSHWNTLRDKNKWGTKSKHSSHQFASTSRWSTLWIDSLDLQLLICLSRKWGSMEMSAEPAWCILVLCHILGGGGNLLDCIKKCKGKSLRRKSDFFTKQTFCNLKLFNKYFWKDLITLSFHMTFGGFFLKTLLIKNVLACYWNSRILHCFKTDTFKYI